MCRCSLARPLGGHHLDLRFKLVGILCPHEQTSRAYRRHLSIGLVMCPYHLIHLLVSIIGEFGTFALRKYFRLILWRSIAPGSPHRAWQTVPLSLPILLPTFPALLSTRHHRRLALFITRPPRPGDTPRLSDTSQLKRRRQRPIFRVPCVTPHLYHRLIRTAHV